MIPVSLAPEPKTFDAKVRQPGLAAIDELVGRPPRLRRSGPRRPKVAEVESAIPINKYPDFWRQVLPDMLEAYEQRCAYLSLYFEPATSSATIDHFVPKSHAWEKVYEWSNFRLCAAVVNTKKGESRAVVDPFCVKTGWFELDLVSFHVKRGARAPRAARTRIDATLPLLNQAQCVAQRDEYATDYQRGLIPLRYVERHAPFVARELRRQRQLLRGDV